ncbi:MAG: molecular chaperone DnaK, partial [Clostridia bacterium]|nr:molecular chaperone DnaK [Clostridia bacterium]
PADVQEVKNAIEKLKETLKGGDIEAIKADTEAVEKSFYKISEKLYSQQAGAQGGDPNNGGAGTDGQDGTYYNASYEDNSGNNN